jgi:hypothetical protein
MINSHPELRPIPYFPTATAANYQVSFEGKLSSDQSYYPKAPCDWRTWPGFDTTKIAGCISVNRIRTIKPHAFKHE